MSDSRSAYRADIDGLRAVAVVPVVFYHAGFEWFSGGYVGVDVFLVISGFLITSIIIDEIRHDAFRVSQFYVRRARRLFPALFTVVLASSAVALLLLMPQELEDFGESVATTAVFASNFLFFSEAGYFDGPAELKPLLHTWSLAIEEQYYLLFPGFLVLLKRHGGARFIAATFAVFAVSLITSVLSVAYAPDAAFYLLPSRTWELLLGSLLALAPPFRPGRGAREALAITGLVLIVCAVFGFSSLTPFPGAAALVPCAGTAMVIAAGMHTDTPTRSGRALSLRPLVFIGLCSYSLYLWHWPILVFAKHYLLRPLAPAEALALVAASMLIAVASWRFVERPFRGAKGWFSTRGLFRFSAALIAAAVVVGLVYDTRNGLPARLPKQVRAIAAMSNDKPPERRHCEGISPAEVRFERLCRVSNLEVAPSFVLWGDSHAMAALPAMRAASLHLGRNGLLAASNGCVPLLGVSRPGADPGFECVAFNAAVLRVIEAHPELTTVILHARWARHAEGTGYADEGGETLYLAHDGGAPAATVDANHTIYGDALDATLDQLGRLGRRVVVIGSIPELGRDAPNVLAKAAWQGRTLELAVPLEAFEARQAFTTRTFANHRNGTRFEFHPAHTAFCGPVRCIASDAGMPLYFDDNHVASSGARHLEPLMVRILANPQSAHAPASEG